MGFPVVRESEIPFLTTAQMVEVDRAMVEDYRILLIQMMENAGRGLAFVARDRFLGGDPRGRRVAVLAGVGGNGGGALVCARRLHGWGAEVEVALMKPDDAYTKIPRHQLDVVRRLGIRVRTARDVGEIERPELIVDGVIGYSLSGDPRDEAARLIDWANADAAPVLALDAPSGLDTSTGTVHTPAIRATATTTLALPKEGLRAEGARLVVGELYLADLSVPPGLYASPRLGIELGPLFAESDVVRIM